MLVVCLLRIITVSGQPAQLYSVMLSFKAPVCQSMMREDLHLSPDAPFTIVFKESKIL